MGYATAPSLLKEQFVATSCHLPAHMEPTTPPIKRHRRIHRRGHNSSRIALFILFLASIFTSCPLLSLVSVSLAEAASSVDDTTTAKAAGRHRQDDDGSAPPPPRPSREEPVNNSNGNNAAPSKNESPHKQRRRNLKVAPLNIYLLVKDQFDDRRRSIEDFVFQSLDAFSTTTSSSQEQDIDATTTNNNNNRGTSPSRLYSYTAFFSSLRTMAVDGILGNSYHMDTNPYIPGYDRSNNAYIYEESNRAFYLSQDDPGNELAVKYAIVNICAFLANAMVEAIQFDACEEFNGMVSGSGTGGLGNSGDGDAGSFGAGSARGMLSELNAVNGRYFPMSNACGQFGKLYQEDECFAASNNGNGSEDESNSNDVISCPVDPNMEVTAELHPKYNYHEDKSVNGNNLRQQPPPPLYCMPKQFAEDYAGYWDGYNVEFIRRVAYPSMLGQVSVQGCCWWGRGALMTRGTCGLGRINHFMGKKAYADKRPSRYPNIDFCKTPSIICGESNAQFSGVVYPELKILVALFDWVDRIQSFSSQDSKWEYLPQLKLFVEGGMEDDSKFIDAVSSVVTRGCDGYYCSKQTIHFMEERRRNFNTLIYDVFNLQERLDGLPTPQSPQPLYDFEYAMRWLQKKRSKIEGNVLISKNKALDGMSYFSQAYKFEPFLEALRTTSYYGLGDQRHFLISDEKEGLRGFNAGLVNLAFFLANAMAESITNDSCDEIHWENVGGQYAIANSCGQNGRDYGGETCPLWQSFMTCNVNTEAEINANVPATSLPPFMLDAQPPPLQCRAGTNPVGYWDEATRMLYDNTTFLNSYGRTDVEGCCFWGRGALGTRGSCNYGKLNFNIGAQAAAENRPSIYPDIDFCTNPSAICSDDSMEMRYVVGMFEWIDRVQDYYDSTLDWSYQDELYKFVDNGMDDDVFIDSVSNIVTRGCHVSHNYPCSSSTHSTVDTDRFLYGFERRMNFKNIIKLVFELPIAAPADRAPLNDDSVTSPAETQTTRRPTFRPTFKPTPYPLIDARYPTLPPSVSPGTSLPTRPREPTGNPVEFSDVTLYSNGGMYTINNDASSFTDESIVVTENTTLVLEQGGYIEAPLNTDWPAVRVSIASTFIGKGGSVNGSYADTSFIEGGCEDGGEAIHVNNGQSSPETASYAEFYDGIYVIGGDAPGGVGGNALHVNGFGTTAIINGGHFIGGKGSNGDNGLSIYVLNSANVHIRAGTFQGEMKVERHGQVMFYGCFMKNGTRVTGVFADESELDITVRTYYGGEVMLIPVSEQECETAPSGSPTNFPTLSPQPTVPRPNHGGKRRVSYVLIIASVFIFMHDVVEMI